MSSAVRVCVAPIASEHGLIAVTITPTEIPTRAPVNLCAVVDVSGSMGDRVQVKDRAGREVNDGLSVLDIVKHALRTIAHSLGPTDRFSVVAYSTKASVVVKPVEMDESGKESALTGIDGLRPDGQTNIWDGLSTALDVLREGGRGHVTAIVLLTDGQPNVVPPSGHVAMLQRYAETKKFMVPIHTFAFGYNADSSLLVEIAGETRGLYAFIPDATLVGTVFISTLACLFTTLSTNATLVVEYDEEPKKERLVKAPFPVRVRQGAVVEMDIGALYQEQPRTVVVSCAGPVRVAVRYSTGIDAVVVEASMASLDSASLDSASMASMASERARQEAAQCIVRCVELGKRGLLDQAREAVREILANPDLPATLRVDVEGQVCEALSKEHFTRWGQHYLPSLGAAHLFQVSNNCKDPGVQVYGGALFRALRADTEDIFLSLPPPVVMYAYRMQPAHSYGSSATAPTAPTAPNMAVYADYAGGSCFYGECPVAMHDGSTKRVKEVTTGDVVLGGATVVCVVRTDTGNPVDMTRVGQLLVTAWHPIRDASGAWAFPCTVAGAEVVERACYAVYNFALDKGHEVTIAGLVCVTLGHGFGGPVVSHPYFGTRRVIEDLERASGWSAGLVRLVGAIRNEDGLVCGIIAP
jgi:Mg-chelatase subunit ChlD